MPRRRELPESGPRSWPLLLNDRSLVKHLVREELAPGRVEIDDKGRVRLRADALEPEVVRALAAIVNR